MEVKKYKKKDLKLLAVSTNIIELEEIINEFFFSKYYYISDDLMLHNSYKYYEFMSEPERYEEWFTNMNQMFKIIKTDKYYRFYRYYGL